MAKPIMIQGTSSDAGKSILTTGLCRIFAQDGYKVAPFKAQNMSRNSYIIQDKKIISKSIAIQAFAANTAPSADMNPIVMIPVNDVGSKIIINGNYIDTMKAEEYYKRKKEFGTQVVKASFDRLAEEKDVIVIEGAGSPAEINLKEHDIVNMGMARLANSPVILVGDIDRGGVFASLAGTQLLLDEVENTLLKGVIINKFRGDINLLIPGLNQIEKIMKRRVLGVVPYLDIDIEKEDSLSMGSNEFQSEKYTAAHMDENINKLAQALRDHLNMDEIYKILEAGVQYV